jgi:Inorganic pyrophosphatase
MPRTIYPERYAAVATVLVRLRSACHTESPAVGRRILDYRSREVDMELRPISTGRNPPTDLHAVIEIPLGGVPVKYEMDKKSGALFVDRFLHTATFYPGNYGFIPQTFSTMAIPATY